MRNTKEKLLKTLFDYRLISLNTRYAKKSKNVIRNAAPHADVLRLVTRSSPRYSIAHKGNIFYTIQRVEYSFDFHYVEVSPGHRSL